MVVNSSSLNDNVIFLMHKSQHCLTVFFSLLLSGQIVQAALTLRNKAFHVIRQRKSHCLKHSGERI